MMVFDFHHDDRTGEDVLATELRGTMLLESPLYNKGTAFPDGERHEFGLDGLLPPHITDLDEQLERTYGEFRYKHTPMEKHIYLRALQDRNEVLFYHLVLAHVDEMMPLIYTPTVGEACQRFSQIIRRPRGLFVSYPQRDVIERILDNRPHRDVDVIVVTDGERILGLGDQGCGGMGIPIGKLSLYSSCGGIHPARTLPLLLDVGTDTEERLNDPHYLGWRHHRVRGQEYLDFIERFVQALTMKLPHVLLQWEDFSRDNATRLLDLYRDRLCTFNDDIQGTAAVTVAAMLGAMRQTGRHLADQRIVLLGAGSAALGIATQFADALVAEGVPEREAAGRFWILNSRGLLTQGMSDVQPFQRRFARPEAEVAEWTRGAAGFIDLAETVRRVRPSALIGVSGQPGTFAAPVIREMAAHAERPIVFPLSNPTSRAEATPEDLYAWTDGRCVVATGSPFAPVAHGGTSHAIPQCNNSYVFPGVGLGVVASGARRVTPAMFMAASRELAAFAAECPGAPLLPGLPAIRECSRRIAIAVGTVAIEQGLAPRRNRDDLTHQVERTQWRPRYPRLVPAAATVEAT